MVLYCSSECWGYVKISGYWGKEVEHEDHWSCIAHLSAENMLKSVVIEEKKLNQRTTGPVSLTWVLRICWIRTNLEIQEHSKLYKLGQPMVIIWKKATRHRHTGTTWYQFWQHFKAFIIPNILYPFQKDPFCLIILDDIFLYFIHVYIAPGQEETTIGDNFLMQAERSYHFDHWLYASNHSAAL